MGLGRAGPTRPNSQHYASGLNSYGYRFNYYLGFHRYILHMRADPNLEDQENACVSSARPGVLDAFSPQQQAVAARATNLTLRQRSRPYSRSLFEILRGVQEHNLSSVTQSECAGRGRYVAGSSDLHHRPS